MSVEVKGWLYTGLYLGSRPLVSEMQGTSTVPLVSADDVVRELKACCVMDNRGNIGAVYETKIAELIAALAPFPRDGGG